MLTDTMRTDDRDPATPPTATGDHRRWRRLSIALNAADRLWRPAVCRLAADLPDWVDREPTPELAARLGVPWNRFRRAAAVLPRADILAEREESAAEALGAHLTTRWDDDYPPPLLDLALPPPVLYHRGPLPTLGSGRLPAVALVGSRKASADGREIAELFAGALAEAGVVVVSGFARGIDGAAHRAAAEAHGLTVAVLGCGLGVPYPHHHRTLGDRIVAQGGALVSEWRCDTEPRGWRFPVRNRLIAALARITLVVQATHRSGSLITARHALELGRDVWAVPGGLFDERATGTNALLRDGAFPALTPRDLLEVLGLGTPRSAGGRRRREPVEGRGAGDAATTTPPSPAAQPVGGDPGRLLAELTDGEAREAESLADALELPLDRVLAMLLELELAGRLRRVPGPAYQRC